GMMGLDQITVLTHHLESRFEKLRSGRIELDRETTNLTLRCVDFLRTCNDRLRNGDSLSSPDELLQELRALEDKAIEKQRRDDLEEKSVADVDALIAEVTRIEPEDALDSAPEDASSGDRALQPEMDDADLIADPDRQPTRSGTVVLDESNVLDGTNTADDTLVLDDPLSDVPGEAGAPAQADAPGEAGADQASETEPATAALDDYHLVVEFTDTAAANDNAARQVAQRLSDLGLIRATKPDLDEAFNRGIAIERLDVILGTDVSLQQMLDRCRDDTVVSIDIRVPMEPDREPLTTWRANLSEAVDTRQRADASQTLQADDFVGTAASGRGHSTAPVPDVQRSSKIQSKSATGDVIKKPTRGETMRVDIERLDELMNLAGELVVNRARFIQFIQDIPPEIRKGSQLNQTRDFCDTVSRAIDWIRERQNDDPRLAESLVQDLHEGLGVVREQTHVWEHGRGKFAELDEAVDQLTHVSESIQRGVMGTRMVPIGPLFNRLKRVIRDLALEFGKDVDLVVEGEATELDKRMIDELADPLIHLVRNSLDHGMELPEDRKQRGKPATGTVRLAASHHGNQVFVQVIDDGRGIDTDAIGRRLVERDLETPESLLALTKRDLIHSIFRPGFSTAAKVTDISGRGVGMDIVKSRIEALGGTVDVETTFGQGSTMTLKLPLTLAIISSLLVRIGPITFSVATDDVREIVPLRTDRVVEIHGRPVVEFRGEFLPVLTLSRLFRWNDDTVLQHEALANTETSPDTETSSKIWADGSEVVVLESTSGRLALVVDRAIGKRDVVIKSLTDHFGAVRGLSGATILGDGEVALMLDVAELPKLAAEASNRVTSLPSEPESAASSPFAM
ncbi:MAG: chemotaxis protein CheA, partial [Planctomycetota bacterium]